MKAKVHKLDINKLVNVSNVLNNLKIKLDDLDVHKLKTVPVGLKKLSDGNEVRSCKNDSVQQNKLESK